MATNLQDTGACFVSADVAVGSEASTHRDTACTQSRVQNRRAIAARFVAVIDQQLGNHARRRPFAIGYHFTGDLVPLPEALEPLRRF